MPTFSLNAPVSRGFAGVTILEGVFTHCTQVEEKLGASGPFEIPYDWEHFLTL